MLNDQFLVEMRLDRARIPSFDEYPFSLNAVRNLDTLALHESVTFIIGESGCDKMTTVRLLNRLDGPTLGDEGPCLARA